MTAHPSVQRSHVDKLDGVQFGRAIAACLVVFYHTGRMLTLPQYVGGGSLAKDLFAFGNAGVDFFFVLSGFVIFYVHQSDIGRPKRLDHYIWRRLTRIYPMYWVATALLIAIALLKRDWGSLGFMHLVTSILLIPNNQEFILIVGWTLPHELLFYAVFAVAIYSRRIGIIAALAWLVLILAGLFNRTGIFALWFVNDPYHFEFAFGIAAAIATKRSQARQAWIAAVAGVLAFACIAGLVDAHIFTGFETICRLLYGIASALILYGVSVSEKIGQIRIPRWAAYFGAASYSIYLMHTMLIGFAARGLFQIPAFHDFPNLSFAIVAAITVGAGCAIYQFVERPLQRTVRKTRLPFSASPMTEALK